MSDDVAAEAAAANEQERRHRETVESHGLNVEDPTNTVLTMRKAGPLALAKLATLLLEDAATIGDPYRASAWVQSASQCLHRAREQVNETLDGIWSGNATRITTESLDDYAEVLG